MKLKNIQDINVAGLVVMLRLDLNLPIDNGQVQDTFRIDAVLPTINYLIEHNARVVIMSHLGRPNGVKDSNLSLSIIAPILSKKLGCPVKFINDCIGDIVDSAKSEMADGDIILLENLRFYPGEESNDKAFSKALAKDADIYIDDAFATAHRAHASTVGITEFLPSYAGFLVQEEVKALSSIFENPSHPLTAIIAGAKVSTKIGVLKNLLSAVDNLIIDGAMGTTFLYSLGYKVGKSLYEPEMAETARQIISMAEENSCKIVLALDKTVAKEETPTAESYNRKVAEIQSDDIILDTGLKSSAEYNRILEESKMLVWCGPVGKSEWPKFRRGSAEIAKTAGHLTSEKKLISIVGGGDTVAVLNATGEKQNMTYVSTAGGAFLEFIEGKILPGIKVLIEK